MAEGRPVRPRPRPARDEDGDRRYDERERKQPTGSEPARNEPEGSERPRRRARRPDDGDRAQRRPPPRGDGELTAAKAARLGLQQIAELTGKPTEGVAWVERGDDDGWAVGVEVVEDRRIPSAADILAIYETEFDADGEMLSYRRVRRYSRGRADNGDGGRLDDG